MRALMARRRRGPSPWSRSVPVTSRNASSMETGSSSGVKSARIAMTSRETAAYLSMSTGTNAPSGQSRARGRSASRSARRTAAPRRRRPTPPRARAGRPPRSPAGRAAPADRAAPRTRRTRPCRRGGSCWCGDRWMGRQARTASGSFICGGPNGPRTPPVPSRRPDSALGYCITRPATTARGGPRGLCRSARGAAAPPLVDRLLGEEPLALVLERGDEAVDAIWATVLSSMARYRAASFTSIVSLGSTSLWQHL